MNEKILITSATGKTGYATAVQLLNEGYPVRIFVRSRNAKAIELEKRGAEIALGTFDNYGQLQNALTGISRVYYCYPIMPRMPENVAQFIKAAREAAIDAVVFMGQRIAEFADTGSVMTNDTRTAYRLFAESGLNVVYFVPGYFADNVFVLTEFVLQLGLLASPFGVGKNPWISNGDMSRSIAALLKNPAPYYGQKLFPTGPTSIDTHEMAAIFSTVSGRNIRVVNSPDWLFLKFGLMLGREFGFDPFAIVQANFYNRQMRLNRFDIAPTDVVKQLTGREPDDFETITRDYFARSPYWARNFGNWLSAMKKFMMMPLTPVPGTRERERLNQ
ncbi:NmrA family NAD(P)-binding protein [Spirosoma arcticum]